MTVNTIEDVLTDIRAYIQTALGRLGTERTDKLFASYIKESVKGYDNYLSESIKTELIGKFGDIQWVVELETFVKPMLNENSDQKHQVIYKIKKLSWISGPSIIAVEKYIRENFNKLLPSKEFNTRIYKRMIPFIDRRVVQTYKPLSISNRKFSPIPIFISLEPYKINEKETKQIYKIEVKDPALGHNKDNNINKPLVNLTVKGWSCEEALMNLQTALERIYFYEEQSIESRTRYEALMRYTGLGAGVITTGVVVGEEEDNNNNIMTPQSTPQQQSYQSSVIVEPLITVPFTPIINLNDPKSRAEKDADKAEEDAMFQEGEEIADVDGPNVNDVNSIPPEENVEAEEPGVPPSESDIDHNHHDDEREDLTEEANEENGLPPGGEEASLVNPELEPIRTIA